MKVRLLLLGCALIADAASATRYEIDPAETRAGYETKYLGIFPVRGIFTSISGALHYAPVMPAATRPAQVSVVIDATSLTPTTFDSESKRSMLRGEAFFYVEKFPTIE